MFAPSSADSRRPYLSLSRFIDGVAVCAITNAIWPCEVRVTIQRKSKDVKMASPPPSVSRHGTPTPQHLLDFILPVHPTSALTWISLDRLAMTCAGSPDHTTGTRSFRASAVGHGTFSQLTFSQLQAAHDHDGSLQTHAQQSHCTFCDTSAWGTCPLGLDLDPRQLIQTFYTPSRALQALESCQPSIATQTDNNNDQPFDYKVCRSNKHQEHQAP